MLPTRDPPQNKTSTYTKSEGLKNIPSKCPAKKSNGSNIYIRQNRLQNKGHKKTHRRTLHDTQGKNPSKRHKYYKYICTQHWSTQIYKENLEGLQERYRQQHTCILGDFIPHCKQWIDLPNKISTKDIVELNDTLDQMDLADM